MVRELEEGERGIGGGGRSRRKQGLFLPPSFLLKPEPGPGQASRNGAEERRWGGGGGGGGGSEHASISVSTAKLQLIHPRSSSVCVCLCVCVCAQLVCACLKFSRSLNTAGGADFATERKTDIIYTAASNLSSSIHTLPSLSLLLNVVLHLH